MSARTEKGRGVSVYSEGLNIVSGGSREEVTDAGLNGDIRNAIVTYVDEAFHRLLGQLSKKQTFSNVWEANVARLFVADELVGTVTFIEDNLLLTAFHNVYEEDTGTIYEKTLCVKSQSAEYRIRHVASFPIFDFSAYKLIGIKNKSFFTLGIQGIQTGDEVFLLAHPKFDEGDWNKSKPTVSHGIVAQISCPPNEQFCLADYQCFPSCSGGAIIKGEELVGLHLASVYHNHAPLSSNVSDSRASFDDCFGPVKTLHWFPPHPATSGQSKSKQKLPMESKNALQTVIRSVEELNIQAESLSKNCFEKCQLGSFIPSAYIRGLIKAAIPKQHNQGDRKRKRTG